MKTDQICPACGKTKSMNTFLNRVVKCKGRVRKYYNKICRSCKRKEQLKKVNHAGSGCRNQDSQLSETDLSIMQECVDNEWPLPVILWDGIECPTCKHKVQEWSEMRLHYTNEKG